MRRQLHQLDNLTSTAYATTTSSTWQLNMHVVPIRASSPQLIEHRLSSWYEWLNTHRSIKPPTLYIQQGIEPPTLYMNEYAFNRASSPQLYLWMTNATGHQTPNFIYEWQMHPTGHKAPNFIYEWQMHPTGHQAPNFNEYAWTQHLNNLTY
jgi:hypothetical protein